MLWSKTCSIETPAHGNPAAKAKGITITIGGDGSPPARTVSSRGVAGYTRSFDPETATSVTVEVDGANVVNAGNTEGPVPDIVAARVVRTANSGDVANGTVLDVYDGNRFLLTRTGVATLYTYDSDDIFVIDNKRQTGSDGLKAFETKIKAKTGDAYTASVQVVVYDTKGRKHLQSVISTSSTGY